METINWEDFVRVDIRVGRIVSAEVFAAARKPAYVLRVDFAPRALRSPASTVRRSWLAGWWWGWSTSRRNGSGRSAPTA
jgi:hypothetical protein